jgi:hypothetical protein
LDSIGLHDGATYFVAERAMSCAQPPPHARCDAGGRGRAIRQARAGAWANAPIMATTGEQTSLSLEPPNGKKPDTRAAIHTIGTSTRSWEQFIETLKAYGIEAVVDVRSFPASRRFAHFWREPMEKRLPEEGIEYHYLGRELGGYRKGGYEAHMETADFARGLAQLEDLARRRRTAFFCAERVPWKCHRRYIGAKLQQRGWRVIHILDAERTWEFTY